MKETFSNNLKQLRKKMQLSQEQLAEKLGITTQAVSKWECGLSYPDIDLLPVLADLFGVSIDTLLREDAFAAGSAADNPQSAAQNNENDDSHSAFSDVMSSSNTPHRRDTDFPNDDVLRIVQYRGNKLLRKDTYDPNIRIPLSIDNAKTKYSEKSPFFSIKIGHSDTFSFGSGGIEIWGSADIDAEGDLEGSVNAGGIVNCNCDINGSVNAGQTVTCSGDINGSANAGQFVNCDGDINGPVSAGQDVKCGGDISDSVQANGSVDCNGDIGGSVKTKDGNISCGDIGGSATAGNNIDCDGDIGGGVNAGNNVDCDGDIGGGVNAGGSVNCDGDIGGDVQAGGDVACDGDIDGDVRVQGSVTCNGDIGGIHYSDR